MSVLYIRDVHTGEMITFSAPKNMICIGGYRSHHVVPVFQDGSVDHDEWTLRFLDCYTGPIASRFDLCYSSHTDKQIYNADFLKKVTGYTLLSFEDWVPDVVYKMLKKPKFASFLQFVASYVRDTFVSSLQSFAHIDSELIACMLAGTDDYHDLEKNKLVVERCLDHSSLLLAANFDCNVFLHSDFASHMQKIPQFAQACQTKTLKGRRKLFPAESRIIDRCRFSMIWKRATDICIAIRELDIDALCMSKIIRYACAPIAQKMPFYLIWGIVTKVLHFHSKRESLLKTF